MVKSDGVVTALFPFQQLSHSFEIDDIYGDFDPIKEKESNNNVRNYINSLKVRIMSFVDTNNSSTVNKSDHYLAVLDEQLSICDQTDMMIDKLNEPTFGRKISDIFE